MADFNKIKAENDINEIIVYLVINYRGQLINLLKSSGVQVLDSIDDRALITAIYSSIGDNAKFKASLQNFITSLASGSKKTYAGLTINEFVKNGANISAGFTGKLYKNYDAADDGEHDNTDAADPATDANGNLVKGDFANTAAGSFLNTLFTKENINKYIDTGLTLVKNKQALKANQQTIDMAALQVQAQKDAAAAAAAPTKKNNWVIPVVIGSFILAALVVTVIIIKKSKK